jgi:hypothetical protein
VFSVGSVVVLTAELTLRKMSKMKKQEILKNQLIQKAQQYFINIESIFEVN